MRVHRFDSGGVPLFAGKWVKGLDTLTREDGFHTLHDWDGKADRFCDDMIPVEVANFVERVADPVDHNARRLALFILLDYYFLHLIALVAMRAWDEGEANANLDQITSLLEYLQGRDGSGQAFAPNVETMILIATSHFEPDVTAYDGLLSRVRKLNEKHRLGFAVTHGAILGCHLRFGLEITCAGSVPALREDNAPDYPWLGEAVATLLEEFASAGEDRADDETSRRTVEALLLALTPDPDAFLGTVALDAVRDSPERHARVVELFATHRGNLLRAFESHRPNPDAYSPFAFTFNFPHNLVKGMAVDAILRGAPWTLGLDDLLTATGSTPSLDASRRELALRLMKYALLSPDTIRGQPHPAIVYDAAAGLRSFEKAIKGLTSWPSPR